MSSTVKKVEVEVGKIPVSFRDTDRITMRYGINEIPTLGLNLHPANKQVVVPADILQSIKAQCSDAQSSIFEGARTTPDVEIMLRTGSASIGFQGFMASQNYSYGMKTTGFDHHAVTKLGLLDGLVLSIYAPQTFSEEEDQPTGTRSMSTPDGDSVAERISEMLKKMLKYHDNETTMSWAAAKANPVYREYLQEAHERNQPGLELLQAILDESDEADYPALGKPVTAFQVTANTWIMRYLCQDAGSSFLQHFFRLLGEFQLAFIPDMGSGNGKIVPYENFVQGGESKTLDLTGIKAFAGPSRIVPFNQLAIANIPSDLYVGDVNEKKQGGKAKQGLFLYPTGVSGQAYPIEPPAWMDTSLTRPISQVIEDSKVDPGESDPVKQQIAKASKDYAKDLVGQSDSVLETFCKRVYINMLLGASEVVATIPLDPVWTVGTTYTVSARGAGSGGSPTTVSNMFTGVLKSITHSATFQGRDATTTLVFSHVTFGNFSLPLPSL